jgi:hypothetical protein
MGQVVGVESGALATDGLFMWQGKFDLTDRDRARALIATIEQRLASDTDELRAAWRELVTLLAIDQRAETRACQNCRRLSRVTVKRCAYCWHELKPRFASDQIRSASCPRGTLSGVET